MIRTTLAAVVSSFTLTACLSLPFSSSDSEESAYIEAPQQPVVYGTPDWAKLTPGKVSCAEGKSYTIVQAEAGNHMAINWQGKHYNLYHVPTTTGTYRYEDHTSGLVIVQIPDKALLLNSKIGQRLADECRK
jgi:hypothetical protein